MEHVIRTEPHAIASGWHLGICSCGVASGPWPNKVAAQAMIEEHADDVAEPVAL